MTTTHKLETAGAEIAYDVRGPLPTADGRPPLFMIGQPMDASGFDTLASYFADRTVVTYDPRGLGRSVRKDGRVDNAPTVQADDVHAIIEAWQFVGRRSVAGSRYARMVAGGEDANALNVEAQRDRTDQKGK
jgi:pimeloyl-ACP methyl ester carboxylesterase